MKFSAIIKKKKNRQPDRRNGAPDRAASPIQPVKVRVVFPPPCSGNLHPFPLDRLDFCRAMAAPKTGNRKKNCFPFFVPTIVRQNRLRWCTGGGSFPAVALPPHPRPHPKNRREGQRSCCRFLLGDCVGAEVSGSSRFRLSSAFLVCSGCSRSSSI